MAGSSSWAAADASKPHTPCPPGALKRSMKPDSNWVDREGGLPRYIERIACHVHFDHGLDISEAIAIAVADAEKMCSTGESNFGHIHAAPQSEACEAVAHWEAIRAAAHARSAAHDSSSDSKDSK